MTAKVFVKIKETSITFGLKKLMVVVDGAEVQEAAFGETTSVECQPGEHVFELRLEALMNRGSNRVKLTLSDGDEVTLLGQYSRLWGNMKLRISK